MAKQPKEKGITKDRLVGMKVIDGNGCVIGTVKDIGFTVGKAGISLSMEDKDGETKDIAWEEIQAAGDFVILKPQTQTASQTCPTCKGTLSYIQQYQRWYCYNCKKYI